MTAVVFHEKLQTLSSLHAGKKDRSCTTLGPSDVVCLQTAIYLEFSHDYAQHNPFKLSPLSCV